MVAAQRDSTQKPMILPYWYPGKLNTLTLSCLVGTEAKEYLINLCVHPSIGGPVKRVENFSRADLSESIESVLLEIEILKSRVDSVQSVIMCADQPLPTAANLSSEITRLQIDLEDEKLKRCVLELQVNRLEEELNTFKSYRNNYTIQSTSSTNVNDGIVEDSVEVINPRATSHAFSNNENNDTIEILHIDESANALENSLGHQQTASGCDLSQGANLIESVEENIEQTAYNIDPIHHNEYEQEPNIFKSYRNDYTIQSTSSTKC